MKISLQSFFLTTAFVLASVVVHTTADCRQQKDSEEVHGFEQKVHCSCSDKDDQLFCIQYDGSQHRDNWCVPKNAACIATEECCGTWKCMDGTCQMGAAAPTKSTSKMGHIEDVDHGNEGEGHSRIGGNEGNRRKLRGV